MFNERKAKEIANGAKNLLRSKFGLTSKQEEKLFTKRKEVCDSCIFKVTSLDISTCKLCGCVLAMKQKSIESECPNELW